MTRPAGLDPADPASAVLAVVRALRCFPVTSMGTVPQPSLRVLSTGVEHDRGWAVVGPDGEIVTAREVPGLSAVSAVPPSAPGLSPLLTLTPGGLAVRDGSAAVALSHQVGRPVTLRATGPANDRHRGGAPVHLVGVRPAGRTGGVAPPPGADRANIVVELTDPDQDESAWVGRRLRVGQVLLQVTGTPQHCAGVYADVLTPGWLHAADAVRFG